MRRILTLAVLFLALGVTGYTNPAHAIAIGVTFTDLNERLIFSGATNGNPIDYFIANETGVTWTDFHFRLEAQGGGVSVVDISTYAGPGTPSALPADTLDVLDLLIADLPNPPQAEYQASLTFANDSNAFLLYGRPTVDAAGVPEPATLALVAIGLAGIGFARRRTKA